MSLEGVPQQESFAPKFSIWLSKEKEPASQKTIRAAYAGTTFEVVANLVNYQMVGDVRMIGNEGQKDPDEFDRLKRHAEKALAAYIEEEKWKDYSENFR